MKLRLAVNIGLKVTPEFIQGRVVIYTLTMSLIKITSDLVRAPGPNAP